VYAALSVYMTQQSVNSRQPVAFNALKSEIGHGEPAAGACLVFQGLNWLNRAAYYRHCGNSYLSEEMESVSLRA